jgi:hypothetical protein
MPRTDRTQAAYPSLHRREPFALADVSLRRKRL